MTLKEKVTDLCKQRKLSVRELERRAGLKERTIQHWDESEPSGSKIMAVADVLDVPVTELLAVYSSDPDTDRIVYLNKLQRELDKYKKENKKTVTNNGDGEFEIAVSNASERERKIILHLLSMSEAQQDAFLSLAQSFQTHQYDQDFQE